MSHPAVTLRRATHQDLDAINGIIERAMSVWELPERVKRLTLPTYQYTATDLSFQTLWVAEQNRIVVGIVAWETAGPPDWPEPNTALLLHGIYVDPAVHGQGIGRQLFSLTEQAARTENLGGLVVKAQKGSDPFYIAMGMSPLPVTDTRRQFENRYWKAI